MTTEGLSYIIEEMEKKLQELMGKDEYSKFASVLAREATRRDVEQMDDGPFKDYVLENLDEILGGEEE